MLPRIAGNPTEKAIRETAASIHAVKADTRKRRKWGYIRADVLSEWAAAQNIVVPSIEPAPVKPSNKAIAEIVGIWVLIGVVAVLLGFLFDWLIGTLVIEGVAAVSAAGLIGFMLLKKHPEGPSYEALGPGDPWIPALVGYFKSAFKEGAVKGPGYAGRDTVGRKMFAVWLEKGEPDADNEPHF